MAKTIHMTDAERALTERLLAADGEFLTLSAEDVHLCRKGALSSLVFIAPWGRVAISGPFRAKAAAMLAYRPNGSPWFASPAEALAVWTGGAS